MRMTAIGVFCAALAGAGLTASESSPDQLPPTLDRAIEALLAMRTTEGADVTRDTYQKKLLETKPIVEVFTTGTNDWRDVRLAMTNAVYEFEAPLKWPAQVWTAPSLPSAGVGWTQYAVDLAREADARTHVETPERRAMRVGEAIERRLGHGDQVMARALDSGSAGGFNDVVALTVEAPAQITIRLGCRPCRAHLTLADAAGRKIEGDGRLMSSATIRRTLQPGQYAIWAGTFEGEVGRYRLEVTSPAVPAAILRQAAAPAPPAPQEDSLQALVPIGQHLETGLAALFAGARDALSPWQVAGDVDKALQMARADGVVTFRLAPFEFEMIFANDGKDLYYLRSFVLVHGGRAGFTGFEGRAADGPLFVEGAALPDYRGAAEPFGRAGFALSRAIHDDTCGDLPLPSVETFVGFAPLIDPRRPPPSAQDGRAWQEAERKRMRAVCEAIRALPVNSQKLRMDDVTAVGLDAKGVSKGLLRMQFALDFTPTDTTIRLGMLGWRPHAPR